LLGILVKNSGHFILKITAISAAKEKKCGLSIITECPAENG
jgi:hypothetical protein